MSLNEIPIYMPYNENMKLFILHIPPMSCPTRLKIWCVHVRASYDKSNLDFLVARMLPH